MGFTDNFDQSTFDARWGDPATGATLDTVNDAADISTGALASIDDVFDSVEWDNFDISFDIDLSNLGTARSVVINGNSNSFATDKSAIIYMQTFGSISSYTFRLRIRHTPGSPPTDYITRDFGLDFNGVRTIRAIRVSGTWELFFEGSSVGTYIENGGDGTSLPFNTGDVYFDTAAGTELHSVSVNDAGSNLTLDSTPADVNSQTQESSIVSNPATAPTTGNTEVKFDNDLGPAATVNSVTGSNPYTINYTFPRTAAKKFDATGYPLYHEVDAENVTSGNVPYLPVAGQTYTDLSSPVNTAGTLGETYTGSPAATGDQWVYDTNLTGDASITLTVDAQGYWTLSGSPSITSTASFYRIDSTGTVDVEDTVIFTVGGPTSGRAIVSGIVSNIVSNIVSEV
jgi:hypothetical protein